MKNYGRILNINLTNEKIWVEMIDEDERRQLIGSRGLQAKIYFDQVGADVDPLGPDNLLMIGAGALTGTPAPCSGRTTVTFKSPATNRYFKSSVGGDFGLYLRMAGYDLLVIRGAASSLKYIYIEDDFVKIKDATDLSKKDVREVYKILANEYGHDLGITAIGIAGENLVKISSIMSSIYCAAARGGGGAVMGSKNLKAIVASGTQSVKINDPKKFIDLTINTVDEISKDNTCIDYTKYGTAGILEGINELNILPTKNFQYCYDSELYENKMLYGSGFKRKNTGCASCVIGCHRYTVVESGKYKCHSGGPEYEIIAAFGSGCKIRDLKIILKINELCNIHGLDTISTGAVIQWVMECYERGVLTKEDLNGIEANFGNGEAAIKLLKKIALREDIGNILAEGLKIASKKIGKDSWKWAIQANGLEQSRVDTRVSKGYALGFAVNFRGPDHLHSAVGAEFGGSEENIKVFEKYGADRKYIGGGKIEGRASLLRWYEDIYAIFDSLGICLMPTISGFVYSSERMLSFFKTAFGIDMTEEKFMEIGRRILTLERCCVVKEGRRRSDDKLPYRLMNEEVKTRDGLKYINSASELNKMLDEYYTLHDWDLKTGIPKKDLLKELKLDYVISEFERQGIEF